MIFAGKFLLPVVLGHDDSDEDIHKEEVANDQDQNKKKGGNCLKISIVVWSLVIAPRF